MSTRIDANHTALTSPPDLGQWYDIPFVHRTPNNGSEVVRVPVLTPPHSCEDLGQTLEWHWHIDIRFVTDEVLERLGVNPTRFYPPVRSTDRLQFDAPVIIAFKDELTGTDQFCCVRPWYDYAGCRQVDDRNYFWVGGKLDKFGELEDRLEQEDRRARMVNGCRHCPHKGLALTLPAIDGIVTCLGHGLDFDEQTGKVVRRTCRLSTGKYWYRHVAGGRTNKEN